MAQQQLSASTYPFDLAWAGTEWRATLNRFMGCALETVVRVYV